MGGGPNWLPLDRRHHDPAEGRGLGPPSGEARGRLLPHQGRPMAVVGGRNEGTYEILEGRLVDKALNCFFTFFLQFTFYCNVCMCDFLFFIELNT